MRLIKWIFALLVFALLTTSSATAMGGKSSQLFELDNENDAMQIISAQAIDDTLYLIYDQSLVTLSDGQSEPVILSDLSLFLANNLLNVSLCSDGKALFLLENEMGRLHKWNGRRFEKIAALDYEGLSDLHIDYDSMIRLVDPVVIGNALFALLVNPYDGYQSTLIRFSLDKGSWEALTGIKSWTELSLFKGNQLLVLDAGRAHMDERVSVISVDVDNGRMIEEIAAIPGNYGGAIAYDTENDSIYAISNGELLKLKKGIDTPVNYLNASADSSVSRGIWRNQYYFLNQYGVILRSITDPLEESNPLRIHHLDSHPELLQSFAQQNADMYPIEYVSDLKIEDVFQAIAAGDNTVDIYEVMSTGENIQTLMQKGYASPLDSALLIEDISSMYPQIKELLVNDGIAYGFPSQMFTLYSPWSVRIDLLEKLGYSDVPKTFGEYLGMMAQWYENSEGQTMDFAFEDWSLAPWHTRAQAINMLFVQHAITYQTKDQALSFNTISFRESLGYISQLPVFDEYGAPSEGNWYLNPAEEEQLGIFRVYNVDTLLRFRKPNIPDVVLMPAPPFVEGEDPQICAWMNIYIVNPNSQKKDEAMRYLEFYSRNMPINTKYELHPELNTTIETRSYTELMEQLRGQERELQQQLEAAEPDSKQAVLDELNRVETSIEEAERNRWVVSEKALSQYRSIAPFLVFSHDVILQWESVSDILTLYLTGTLSDDQLIKELDAKFRMMWLESQ